MSIITSLEKLRKNLNESTAEMKIVSKSSSAADVVDLSKETPKRIQPNILTHKETNFGKQDFQHVFRLAANAENKERGYYKTNKPTDTEKHQNSEKSPELHRFSR